MNKRRFEGSRVRGFEGSKVDSRDKAAEEPPMSRLFVVCSKSTSETDFRNAFAKFGECDVNEPLRLDNGTECFVYRSNRRDKNLERPGWIFKGSRLH